MRKVIPLLSVMVLLLAACASRASGAVGDPQAGRELFNQTSIGEAPACKTCHSVEPEKVIVGPSLAGVASRAEKRIPEKPAAEYLRESILNPNSYVVEGFSKDVMYQKFEDVLTDEQVDNLVAYLLTLK